MNTFVKAIEEQGVGIGSDIVKVDMILNHRIDCELLKVIGKSFKEYFEDQQPDIILTIEASGIAVAVATAMEMGNIPVVFAKKASTRNITGEVYQSKVFSFTHNVENFVRVAKPYLPKGSKVLIVDDFLANGGAAKGLYEIATQACCKVVGVGICVEKTFQPGRQQLEKLGLKVVSLAKIKGIENGKIIVTE